MKALLVGRHTNNDELIALGIEIVHQCNVTWSLDRREVADQWDAIVKDAHDRECVILLQNVPGILASLLIRHGIDQLMGVKVGIIIAVPGERVADVSKEFFFDDGEYIAKEAVCFANSRAKTEIIPMGLRVTVDPIPQFVLHHIEWIECKQVQE